MTMMGSAGAGCSSKNAFLAPITRRYIAGHEEHLDAKLEQCSSVCMYVHTCQYQYIMAALILYGLVGVEG
jgi:hypothetical protein